MKRWLAREVLLGSAALIASLGMGCKPDQSVKPGAPVLMEMIIASASGATHITSTTPDCTTGLADGAACTPPGDTLCRHATMNNWCNCVADAMDMTMGTWSCAPIGPVASVVAVFDRLIDVSMFDPEAADGNTAPNTASIEVPAGAPTAMAVVNYGANGSTTGLIAHLFGHPMGPNLTISGAPALPSGTAVTVALNKTTVRAKDGKTSFVGEGLLQDGTITFTTGPFAVAVTVPAGMDADGGVAPAAPDMTPVGLDFSNVVDSEAILPHITVTAGGTAVPFTLDPAEGAGTHVSIVPTANWPANATITVTLAAATPDVLNETLGAAVTETFMTGAP